MQNPRRSAILTTVFVLACGPSLTPTPGARPPAAAPRPVTDGRGVLDAMHRRYVGRFFSALSFSQNTVTYSQGGQALKGVWHEYLQVPGKLRIDYTPLTSRSGVLWVGGKVYAFSDGKAQQAPQDGINPLLVLIADVYSQPVDTSLSQLTRSGFTMSPIHETTYEGNRVWVVGAALGDTTVSQFWIDKDSALVRRVIQREQRGGKPVISDIRLMNYQNAGGYPVAFSIKFYRDGRLFFTEDYFDVKTNVLIPPEVFDPTKWTVSQIKK